VLSRGDSDEMDASLPVLELCRELFEQRRLARAFGSDDRAAAVEPVQRGR
jgi:hypothetical protein